jgi:hypothetical protein
MKIAPVVLKLRLAETRFKNKIAGAAELAMAMEGTLIEEVAFVIQLGETCAPNEYENHINQKVMERFAIIAAIKNDVSQQDKTGLTAYDSLFDFRSELFDAILGWQMDQAESIIYYRGGRVVEINRAWLWYQFEFEFSMRLGDDIIDNTEDLTDFDTIYAQYVLAPSANLPVENLPVNIFSPDMTQIVDLTDNPNAGEFGKGFSPIFDTDTS